MPRRPTRRRWSRSPGPDQEVLPLDWHDVTAAALTAQSWPRDAVRTFAAAGGTAWSRAAGDWSAGRCATLAALARRLLDAGGRAGEPVHAAAARLLRTDSRSGPERILARAVAARILLPGPGGVRAAANAIRAAGVYLCLGQGRDLRDCACVEDLGDGIGVRVGVEAVVTILWEALRPLRGGDAGAA